MIGLTLMLAAVLIYGVFSAFRLLFQGRNRRHRKQADARAPQGPKSLMQIKA